MAQTPISVVIRTFNSRSTLPRLLDALPLGPRDELILVDSGSTDGIRKHIGARPYQWVDVSDRPYRPGYSLNAGFQRAQNPLVLAISCHVIPLVSNILNTYREVAQEHPDAAAIAGAIHWFKIDYKPNAPVELITAETIGNGKIHSLGNPNCLYQRNRWALQPFDETVRYIDDHQWYHRATDRGWQLAVSPKAAVHYHGHRDTFSKLFEKGYKTIGESARQAPPNISVINIAKLSAKLAFSCATLERSPVKAAKFLAYASGMWIGTIHHKRRVRSAPPRR